MRMPLIMGSASAYLFQVALFSTQIECLTLTAGLCSRFMHDMKRNSADSGAKRR
jgi:hypothetical protein